MSAQHNSWGRVTRRHRGTANLTDLAGSQADGLLPFGNGRSYGDSCHNDRGRLITMRPGAAIRAFDPETGVLTADAGVLLSDILALVMPQGYFLEVTPGTAQVTLGGAIANDVHGKNHHRRGTFGRSVLSFTLLSSDGSRTLCSTSDNQSLFAATIGGMGLTGVIEAATIRLMPVPSANVRQTAFRFTSIDGYFDAIDEIDARHEYSVAWIDQLARGGSLGRGALMAGDHAEHGGPARAPSAPRLAVPFSPPVNLLNRLTLKAFNALYYARAPKTPETAIVPWASYFHPLDAITGWNRLYGPRGLFQHQSVYPFETGRETTIALIECAQAHGAASFLTVLKRFGDVPSPGLLSFPRPGFTLTLDFANSGDSTLKMLNALDAIVLKAGGALNPYKDQRMGSEMFAASFPNWRELEAMRDPALMSDLWRRTAMALERDQTATSGMPTAARH
ncbi:FAD-binding protein [Hoeflea sp. Naph1]|uniref:FAD-binding protein n=1 Tax=Hoeflea sp. Naph1 TaxID=3388653 RepID=UPI00398FD708